MRKEDEMRNFVIGFIVACVLFCAVGCSDGTRDVIEGAYRTGYDNGYKKAKRAAMVKIRDTNFHNEAGWVFQEECLTSAGAKMGDDGFVGFGEWKFFCSGFKTRLYNLLSGIKNTDKDYDYENIDYGLYNDKLLW